MIEGVVRYNIVQKDYLLPISGEDDAPLCCQCQTPSGQ